jgi:hypothetical protein
VMGIARAAPPAAKGTPTDALREGVEAVLRVWDGRGAFCNLATLDALVRGMERLRALASAPSPGTSPDWMPGGAFCNCGHVEFMVPGPAAVRCEHRGTDPVLHTPVECRIATADERRNLDASPSPLSERTTTAASDPATTPTRSDGE